MGDPKSKLDLSNVHQADEPGVVLRKTVPTLRRKTTTVKPLRKIRARILWPALGFPEVGAPKPDSSSNNDVGDTGRIKLLLVADKNNFSVKDVAEFLRYVPWKDRATRYLPKNPGKCSFKENQIWLEKTKSWKKDDFAEEVYFATGKVVGTLAKFVINFYKENGLKYMYQVCITETASAALISEKHSSVLYHLFWSDPGAANIINIDLPSEEMRLLLKKFAKNRKRETVGCGETLTERAYKYELSLEDTPSKDLVEVLHPLFVWSHKNTSSLKFAHMTDTHVALRSETFEINLNKSKAVKYAVNNYNNYNTTFKELYGQAKKNCDAILMTGDLIEYCRGYIGGGRSVGDEKAYRLDANWFYFYGLLVHDKKGYDKPVYTVLGNHDWRVDPFYPLNPVEKQDVEMNLTEEQMKIAHGPMPSSYALGGYSSAIGDEAMITHIDAIKWYLLLINPFLDYTPRLPGGYSLLMLDWVKEEEVFLSHWSWLPLAGKALTDLQTSIVEWFVTLKGKAKIVGLHAGVVSPWPNWSDEALNVGIVRPCPRCGGTTKNGLCGCRYIVVQKPDKTEYRLVGSRYIVVNIPYQDKVDTDEDKFTLRAAYASIKQKRDWFINSILGNVSVVCCGHVHRNSLLVVLQPGKYKIEGQYGKTNRRQIIESDGTKIQANVLIREGNIQKYDYYGGGNLPASTAVRIDDHGMLPKIPQELLPVYLNTKSAGPVARGRKKDGVPLREPPGYAEFVVESFGKVQSVAFKDSKKVKPLQWQCWLRKYTKAKWVKIYDGGIIAGYDRKFDASAESDIGYAVWQKGAEYECWIKRRSAAADVKLHTQKNNIRGIIGIYYDKEGYKTAKKEKSTDEPWQKWPGPTIQWECWLRLPTNAKWVKLHDGGILAGYDRELAASAETETGYAVWQKGAEYECWIKRKSAAVDVKLHVHKNNVPGIIGIYYDEEGYKAAQKEKWVDEPWKK